jgi:hypothetical protein
MVEGPVVGEDARRVLDALASFTESIEQLASELTDPAFQV